MKIENLEKASELFKFTDSLENDISKIQSSSFKNYKKEARFTIICPEGNKGITIPFECYEAFRGVLEKHLKYLLKSMELEIKEL